MLRTDKVCNTQSNEQYVRYVFTKGFETRDSSNSIVFTIWWYFSTFLRIVSLQKKKKKYGCLWNAFNLQFNIKVSCPCTFASLCFAFLPVEWILKIQSRILLWTTRLKFPVNLSSALKHFQHWWHFKSFTKHSFQALSRYFSNFPFSFIFHFLDPRFIRSLIALRGIIFHIRFVKRKGASGHGRGLT